MAPGHGFLKAVALIMAPVALAVALYNYNPGDFSPAPMPPEYSYGPDVSAPRHEARALERSERVGEGRLPGPEDLAYDAAGGWLRGRRGLGPDRGTPAWRRARGGRRPRRGQRGHRAAEGEPRRECGAIDGRGGGFALTDGVDIAADGTIYFTDASYKYNLANHMADVLETRPHGRLMSFDPSTGRTVVLVRDLYFVNGVAVAPDQSSLIYCETVM
ncbi:protein STRICTOSIDINE SYNTHASE-LIKE 5 [Setaria italica]|uniref:protein STRICTOSIDINE SYNTHASE-LIKE 5 n=1 Tax=Setaria italica TaxID=4555 RepID=UPI00064762B7|nr:protein STRICTOSIDINE SYNTHASE-LIKE 5 [Setaria italica]